MPVPDCEYSPLRLARLDGPVLLHSHVQPQLERVCIQHEMLLRGFLGMIGNCDNLSASAH
jgi:hypothetical protein